MANGTTVDPNYEVERLARELHEAGRAAVTAGATVAQEHLGDKCRPFIEWDDLTDNAKEGRRIQARYLLERYVLIHRLIPELFCCND